MTFANTLIINKNLTPQILALYKNSLEKKIHSSVHTQKTNYTVSIITDVEGSQQRMLDTQENAKKLISRLNLSYQNSTQFNLFLGDATDGDLYDIPVTCSINDSSDIIIAGNRDLNKLRFLLELGTPKYINDFLSYEPNSPEENAHWVPKNSSSHYAYVLAKYKEQNFIPSTENIERQIIQNWYNNLSFDQKQVLVAKWMLEKTMGSPDKFENRRKWIAEKKQCTYHEISDKTVVVSFIEEMCDVENLNQIKKHDKLRQEKVLCEEYDVLDSEELGCTKKLLLSSSACAVIGDTLFTHGNVSSEKQLEGLESNTLENFVITKNEALQAGIAQVYTDYFNNPNFIFANDVQRKNYFVLELSLPNNNEDRQGLVSGSAAFNTAPNSEVVEQLKRHGLNMFCFGHQPTQSPGPFINYSQDKTFKSMGFDTATPKSAVRAFMPGSYSPSAGVVVFSQDSNFTGKVYVYGDIGYTSRKEEEINGVLTQTYESYFEPEYNYFFSSEDYEKNILSILTESPSIQVLVKYTAEAETQLFQDTGNFADAYNNVSVTYTIIGQAIRNNGSDQSDPFVLLVANQKYNRSDNYPFSEVIGGHGLIIMPFEQFLEIQQNNNNKYTLEFSRRDKKPCYVDGDYQVRQEIKSMSENSEDLPKMPQLFSLPSTMYCYSSEDLPPKHPSLLRGLPSTIYYDDSEEQQDSKRQKLEWNSNQRFGNSRNILLNQNKPNGSSYQNQNNINPQNIINCNK